MSPVFVFSSTTCASLVGQTVKRLPAMWETQVQSLGQEDPLEKAMATHPFQYSCLENSMDGGARWATVQGLAKSRTQLSNFTFFLSYNLLPETPFNICPYIFAFDFYRLEPHERNVESNGKNTFRAILNLLFYRHSTLTRRNSIGPTTKFLPQRSDQKTEGFKES